MNPNTCGQARPYCSSIEIFLIDQLIWLAMSTMINDQFTHSIFCYNIMYMIGLNCCCWFMSLKSSQLHVFFQQISYTQRVLIIQILIILCKSYKVTTVSLYNTFVQTNPACTVHCIICMCIFSINLPDLHGKAWPAHPRFPALKFTHSLTVLMNL